MALLGRTIAEKLALNCRREGDCLRWNGAHNEHGYGKLRFQGKFSMVHRVAYTVGHGPIPDGLEIDHVYANGCRFRDCINLAHLEAVTPRENIRRRPAPVRLAAPGTPAPPRRLPCPRSAGSCPQGHEMTPENTKYKRKKSGTLVRRCRTCINDYKREWERRRPETHARGSVDA